MSALPEVLQKAYDTSGLLAPSEVLQLVEALEEAIATIRVATDSIREEVLDSLERP